jgi:hypothetical protein
MTDSRGSLTSGKSGKRPAALISASVTGRFNFLSGFNSTTTSLPVLSFGSGYAATVTWAVPTTAFSLPV